MIDLWVSLSIYGGISTRQILATFEQAGIRSVELAIGPKLDPDTVQAIFDYQERGFRYRAHHAFVWGDRHWAFNLADRLVDWSELQARVQWMATIGIMSRVVQNSGEIDHRPSLDRHPRDNAPHELNTQ